MLELRVFREHRPSRGWCAEPQPLPDVPVVAARGFAHIRRPHGRVHGNDVAHRPDVETNPQEIRQLQRRGDHADPPVPGLWKGVHLPDCGR